MLAFTLRLRSRLGLWWAAGEQRVLGIVFDESAPLDLRIVGRTLLHASLVGLACGLSGAAFFAALEAVQAFLLGDLAGYIPLRAFGEQLSEIKHGEFRPWLLVLLPAIGGLGCGLLTRLAPETRGGGGDAMIEAFHHQQGIIRRRVLWVKPLASLCTLGTGGAGGREGPTMQIGGALGSVVARLLRVSARERRILLVAGVAAGISAVFRTPLGAALLAVEVLYRDGFESDALVPSVLASVVSYSVVISLFGESTLFSHAPRFPFVPAHLPYYALLALFSAALAAGFLRVLARARRLFSSLPIAPWLRPALGGLALGVLCTPVLYYVGARVHSPGQGLGIFGGGYGAVQMAISGASWLPEGWGAVELLGVLSVAKLLAASLTIGSEGSAGDFAPSLAIGGLFGGAFGRALHLLVADPRLDPGAFALIGMGVFYGGIAHVPLSALVLVCELAGNYDLLVPLMLAQGIAFVALRKQALYEAQASSPLVSPAHRDGFVRDLLRAERVKNVMSQLHGFLHFTPATSASTVLERLSEAPEQEVFPVIDGEGKLVGLVGPNALRIIAGARASTSWMLVADIMLEPKSVLLEDDLVRATQALLQSGLRQLPVTDQDGRIVGFLAETQLARVSMEAALRAERSLNRGNRPSSVLSETPGSRS